VTYATARGASCLHPAFGIGAELGTVFPDHTHGVDKIDAVISGRFGILVSGHLAMLGPGDWVSILRGSVQAPRWSATTR
jgi:ethanolamine utilization protein EutQ (cupin superfamily)